MKATGIRVKHGTSCKLEATVQAMLPRKSFQLFYRFPTEFAKSVQVSADPFIAALLLPSMELGEPLIVDAAASSRLLGALPKIMAFYHNRDPRFKIIKVKTLEERRDTESSSNTSALFFSCGLDSFHALTKLTERNREENNLTHLIFVHGFDIKLDDASLFERSCAAARDVASYYEKELVVVTTNIREVTNGFVGWDYCCGAGIASVGLGFGNFFRKIYIASDMGPNDVMPLSVHPDLDPLWSTETTTFIHYCYGISRIEKANVLANNCMAQKHLRVCWENRNGAYNCGSCNKCVRTMLTLYLAGALSNFNFPTKLTPELVYGMNYDPHSIVISHAEEILHELQQRGDDELADALSHAIRKTSVREGWIEVLKRVKSQTQFLYRRTVRAT